jgi:hypothetical protein
MWNCRDFAHRHGLPGSLALSAVHARGGLIRRKSDELSAGSARRHMHTPGPEGQKSPGQPASEERKGVGIETDASTGGTRGPDRESRETPRTITRRRSRRSGASS